MTKTLLSNLFVICTAALFIFSCGKKDVKSQLTANTTEITLHYKQTFDLELKRGNQVIDFSEITSSSSDDYVGRITSDGVFEALHIGETELTMAHDGDILKLIAKVTPKQQLFKEPILDFGKDKNFIKQQEKRTLQYDLTTGLVYAGENSNIRRIIYLFENGRCTGASVEIPVSSLMIERVLEFYQERYNYRGQSDEYFIHTNKGERIIVGLTAGNGYLTAIYAPNSSLTSKAIIQQMKNLQMNIKTSGLF